MTSTETITTRLSTKGQLILPQAIRQRRKWAAGTQLTVRDTPEGVLINAARATASATMDEIFGCLPYDGPPRSIEEMDAGVLREARRSYARD